MNARKLRAELAQLGPIARFVAHAGVVFLSAPLTDDEQTIVRKALGRKRPRMKECFHNAQRLVMADATKRLRYVEGFCFGPFGPIHHAWAAIGGKVVDVTVLDDDDDVTLGGRAPLADSRVLGTFDEARVTYIGVVLSKRDAFSNPGGSALDDWEKGYPVIRAYEKRTGECFLSRSKRGRK